MKVLRFSLYPPDIEPVTIVMRDTDLAVSIDEAVQAHIDSTVPGFFVHEIFEVEDDTDIGLATSQALERLKVAQAREKDSALLYWWDRLALQNVSVGGVLSGSKPAPLSSEEIKGVLAQLAKAPEAARKTVIAIAEDYSIVKLQNGKVEIVKNRP